MPLVDQHGNLFKIKVEPQEYDVKIVSSRYTREARPREPAPPRTDHRDGPIESEESISTQARSPSPPKKTSNEEKRQGKWPSKNRNEIIYKQKIDIPKKKIDRDNEKPRVERETKRKISQVYSKQDSGSSSKFTKEAVNSKDLNAFVKERMGSVASRTVDLMVMEMRKLDRDRDRVLVPDTVTSVVGKYNIDLGETVTGILMERFKDRKEFRGMVNYEEMVRYLEEMRIEADRNSGKRNSAKKESFILAETESRKAQHKRNKLWTGSMEEKLTSEVRKELGHYPDLSLVQLAAALQARDSYSRASVSSPQLRSVLRAEGVSLSNKAMAGLMRASDLEDTTGHAIPVILDIFSKATANYSWRN